MIILDLITYLVVISAGIASFFIMFLDSTPQIGRVFLFALFFSIFYIITK